MRTVSQTPTSTRYQLEDPNARVRYTAELVRCGFTIILGSLIRKSLHAERLPCHFIRTSKKETEERCGLAQRPVSHAEQIPLIRMGTPIGRCA